MRTVAIIQARMDSKRLPGKVMKVIGGVRLIDLMIRRVKKTRLLDDLVVATTTQASDDILCEHLNVEGVNIFRGSAKDVLARFIGAANFMEADVVVRLTADCPLIDPEVIDLCISRYFESGAQYVSNTSPATFPDGLDVEVLSKSLLQSVDKYANTQAAREHVTAFIRESDQYSKECVRCDYDLSSVRLTVDEPEDLDVIERVLGVYGVEHALGWKEILNLSKKFPNLFSGNAMHSRNEGMNMKNGQKFWRRARRVIPGGNMLLSKRPEMFLPDNWPTYFSKARGVSIWDLDNNHYYDLSIMGIGTNILGYGDERVDAAVNSTIANGNMSTFNCLEEVLLAEKLIELHPWADMVRFARTGGEANAIAIRIARAASGRDKVAICGYHGWHDWYLATNLSDSCGLDNHLLPGLDPVGVPGALKGSVIPFQYNNLDQLEEIIKSREVGVIMMEVSRNFEPESGYLQGVRSLADKYGVVLCFDECTSGFRQTLGGLHLLYGVSPDIAMFGKAMGNGYAITAVVGTAEVMDCAQSSFISSTFWTERIGPTAALATIDIMEKERSYETISHIGTELKKQWSSLATEHKLEIRCGGLAALPNFTFAGDDTLAYKTLITQEALKDGILAANSVYVCVKHTQEIIDMYLNTLAEIFLKISKIESGEPLDRYLKHPVCHSGFKRLN